MKKIRDLSNQTFDRWTVLPQYRYMNGQKQWLCVCSCEEKNAKYVFENNLLQGRSKSCGCLSRERARARCTDLKGQRFGALEVKSKAENRRGRTAWNCKCDCGSFTVVTTHELLQNKTKSCGCRTHVKGRHIRDLTKLDLGVMEVLYPTEERDYKGGVMWHCRCKKCGREKSLSEDVLVNGNYKSCGCTRHNHCIQMMDYRHFYQGTCLESLQRKVRSDNKTGVAGVSVTKNGKYRVSIGFKGKPYSLGRFETLEEAAAVRGRAERQLHQPFIEAYTAWLEKSEEESEEFKFKVDFYEGEFIISSNYLPD